jgi:protein-S-isoprenylcysteine O-methyltransferase Ste14
VSSPARLRRQRRLRLTAGLALAVAGAGYLTAFAILIARGALDATAIVIMGWVGTAALALVITGAVLINSARRAMGVRLQRDGQQEVRRPGSTVSYESRWRDINI